MHFTRVSITQKEVTLNYSTPREGGGVIEHELVDRAKPLASFPAALQAFAGFALQLIGAPKEWDDRLRVTTLNLHNAKDGRRGLQVSFNHPVDKARGAAVSITTPTLWEADNLEGEVADGFYGSLVHDLIEAAEAEATRYYNGEKEKQAELALVETTAKKTRGAKGVDDVTDDKLRQLLLQVERDVPMEAIARWSVTDRHAAMVWSTAVVESLLKRKPCKVQEPGCVERDATLPLSAEEHHQTTATV